MRKITIGTDPEFFMVNRKTNKLTSAIPYIKGNKYEPQLLPSGSNIQHDNVAVEFATRPASSSFDFIKQLKQTFTEVLDVMPKDMELMAIPSADFPDDQLDSPEACEFGCSPDYDAWDIKENSRPIPPNPNFRSCGGHVHVGCIDEEGNLIDNSMAFLLDPMGKILMVRGMDLFHGIISTVLDSSAAAIKRRELYGKAGCHRPTAYGVEYRTLSNYWTKTPYSSMLISSLTDDVVDLIISEELEDLISKVGADKIQDIINNGDSQEASRIINNILVNYISTETKFYLDECLMNLGNAGTITKEWSLAA